MRPRTAEHGTRARYNRAGDPCRCDDCRAANRLYAEQRRRAAGMQPQRIGFSHGTRYGYRRGCRCDSCREAHNGYYRRYRRRAS